MKKVGNMKLYPFEEIEDEIVGKKGTPRRDAYEAKLQNELHTYQIGETIRNVRLQQHLTQEELGERVGVQRAQISRIERGSSITFPTMSRIFKALGVSSATLDLENVGKVVLW